MSETLKQEMAFEHEKHVLKMSQERELYEEQLQFQKALKAGEHNQMKKVLSTKLPKLCPLCNSMGNVQLVVALF